MERTDDFEQFAYVVSHDLQEQVRNITNFSGLMEKNIPPECNEDFRFYLGVVTGSASKLNDMVVELLTFSRVGRDKNFEQVSVQKLLADLLDSTPAAQNAKIHIGTLPEVRGNFSEIRLLFQNLMDNALKFNDLTAPEISVDCKNKSTYWEFSIKDNGIGISENHLTRIFVMFQRLNPEEEYPGNGAGLAICKKIIEKHKGKMWAESEPGKGSAFYFTIPITELSA